MVTQSFHLPEPIIPSESEVELARASSRVLSSISLKKGKTVKILFENDSHQKKFCNFAIFCI